MYKMRVPKVLKSVRYCLIAVNSLFLLTGKLLLVLGLVTRAHFREYTLLVTNKFFTLPNFVIATAVIIIFVSILGYYGAWSEQFYFIAGYVALLLVVLVFEISITTMGFKLRNGAENTIRTPMSQTLLLYGSRSEINITWDNLQSGFQCCGVSGNTDWMIGYIPISCCHIDFGTISPFECTYDNAYTIGCASVLGDYLAYNVHVIAATGAFVLSLQVLITAAGGWLSYRSRYEEIELES